MRGVAVCNVDTAGGVIKTGSNVTVTFNGQPLAVVGCEVAPHGNGPHQGAVMVQGNPAITINGIPVCFQGDRASCGDTATGQPLLSVTP